MFQIEGQIEDVGAQTNVCVQSAKESSPTGRQLLRLEIVLKLDLQSRCSYAVPPLQRLCE